MALPSDIAPSTSDSQPSMWGYSEETLNLSSPQTSDPQDSMWQYTEGTQPVSSPDVSDDLQPDSIPWVLLTLSPPPPPYLISGPRTPNGNFMQLSMDWFTGSDGGVAIISRLLIGGKTAIINNAIQAGFAGTVAYESTNNGFYAQLVATEDVWKSAYYLPWTIYINNGVETQVNGVIVKYVTLPYPADEVEIGPIYLSSFRFPLQFKTNCDIKKTTDERAIAQNMTLSVMVRLRGIPMACHLGSRVPLMPFDPNDVVTREALAAEVYRAIGIGEPRAHVSTGIITSGEEHTAKVIVPYTIPMKRNWDMLSMSIPIPRLDGGGGRVTPKEPPSYSVPYQPNAVNPEPPPPYYEDEDMPSPSITYVSGSIVNVDVPPAAMSNSIAYKLKGGTNQLFNGSVQCNLNNAGVGGLDTGSKAANKCYHLYLVSSNGELKPIFSLNGPATGPSGYSGYLLIGTVFTNDSGDLYQFDYVGAWYRIRNPNDCVRLTNQVSASPATDTWFPVDLSDPSGWIFEPGYTLEPTNFPGFDVDVIDEVELSGLLDEDSGNAVWWIQGSDGTPSEFPGDSGISYANTGASFAALAGAYSGQKTIKISVPDGKVYHVFRDASDSIDFELRMTAFRHKYRY